jgi:5-methylcytosine-specific restriction endonuclease McrA
MARLTTLGPRVARASVQRVRTITTGDQRIVPNSIAHKAIKRAIRARSQGWCECTSCAQSGAPLPAHEFDHRVPLWEGGGNELGNWQHLSRDCHRAKSASEARRRLGL